MEALLFPQFDPGVLLFARVLASHLVLLVLFVESGDEGEYIIGLFSNEVEVSITNVQLDWFKFGELEDKEGKLFEGDD